MEVVLNYEEFLASKAKVHGATGLSAVPPLRDYLFDWQKDVVRWALRKGRACLFEDCGLGKTPQQLEWASHVPGDVLVLAPLAVADQTHAEGLRWGYDTGVSRTGDKAAQTTITNYEQFHKFDIGSFAGVVLDESSIIKSKDGKFRRELLSAVQDMQFRLACTATPAPNDHMELGNHAEFVGAMTAAEMLATYFVHDGGQTSKWRLKGHAVDDFWQWVASWAALIRTPADIGHDGSSHDLPELRTVEHVVATAVQDQGQLFAAPAVTLNDQRRARRETMDDRVAKVADIVNSSDDPFIVWCELNAEGDALERAIPGSVQVAGRDSDDEKRRKMRAFSDGSARVIVTKPKIAGFGMNWQHCAHQVFVGLSHSWEQYYQAVRRSYRFGQSRPVTVHVVSTDREVAVLQNIKRKQAQADEMATQMVNAMGDTMMEEIRGVRPVTAGAYETASESGDGWVANLGDCVDGHRALADNSVHFSVFSPPFASLYTYSASDRDMGNVSDDEEFMAQYRYLVAEQFRVTMPGRLVSFHCMNLPSSKLRHGFIGLRDFRGDLIRMYQDAGFIFHSEVCIWKDPVTSMQRTKALGLLHKQIRKDSAMSRQGIPDYLVTMRKPGANREPVAHPTGSAQEMPVEVWQRYASPVWMDINPSDTLQYRSARENEDERHICPLQLGVIRRAIKLWSNPGDTVVSPFMGIGSEGVVAREEGRKFIGFELKRSYWNQARKNLAAVDTQPSLFSLTGIDFG